MSLIWNNRISVSYFGEPSSSAIGVTIDSLPAGEYIDAEELVLALARRSPKSCPNPTAAKGSPRIISGISGERTTGETLCAFLPNKPVQKPEQEQSGSLSGKALPGHADYTGAVRYKGFNDVKQLYDTAGLVCTPLCFAGAVCSQILARRGIHTGAHIRQIHNTQDNPFDCVALSRDAVLSIRKKDFPVINDRRGWLMLEDIAQAEEAGESLGGIIECASVNVPAGVGSPVSSGLANSIAQLVFGIPGVVGLEFGAGFSAAGMVGHQCSDEFYVDEHGRVLTRTNNHGGTLGGISTGMPITLNVAVRPSAARDDAGGQPYRACSVPGIVPAVEAAVSIALLTHMLDYPNFC